MTLDALLRPRSVVVIGGSADPAKNSGRPLRFLRQLEFRGPLYAVNPTRSHIGDVRSFPTIGDLPEVPDLAVVVVRASSVESVIRDCAVAGVRAAIIMSAGFAEVGSDGHAAQRRLADARGRGLRICGPNSVGVISMKAHLGASFSQVLEHPDLRSGPVAMLTQSGAFGTLLLSLALERGLGFAYFVATGNEADVELSEVGLDVVEDEAVRVVAIYAESLRNGASFLKLAQRATALGKDIILLRAGHSPAGSRAIRSHTGALAQSAAFEPALYRQLGVMEAADEEEFLGLLTITATCGRLRSGPISVVSTSGALGALVADQCHVAGLPWAELSADSVARLQRELPPFASRTNPIDVTGEVLARPELVGAALRSVVEAGPAGPVLVCIGMLHAAAERIRDDIVELAREYPATLAVAWVGGPPAIVASLHGDGVPVFETPIQLVRALDRMTRVDRGATSWSHPLSTTVAAVEIPSTARHGVLLGDGALDWLRELGLPTARASVAHSAEEAVDVGRRLGLPVALKAHAATLWHKTEIGGVELDLGSDDAVREAYGNVHERAASHGVALDGVLIQEMIPRGLEFYAGVTQTAFGPAVLAGMGGIYLELFRDVTYRLAPFDLPHASNMLSELSSSRLLHGYRGSPKLDIVALEDLLVRLSHIAWRYREAIVELDLNPIFVHPEGAGVTVADAKIRFAQEVTRAGG